jgi:hypothetical protein
MASVDLIALQPGDGHKLAKLVGNLVIEYFGCICVFG